MCPAPSYQERPPSKFWHQAIGWSAPIAPLPGLYVDSSRVIRTWTSSRGFVVKLYHSSKRTHSVGSISVDGWPGLSRRIVAVCCAGWLRKRAPPPVSSLYHGTVCIESVAACSPTYPPPSWM